MPEQLQDQARDVANQAQSQGREVARQAAEEAGSLAEKAKAEAGQITEEIKTQGRQLADETRQQVRQQADAQVRHLAEGIEHLGDQARALAEGRPQEAGPFGDAATEVADRLGGLAYRVETGGLDAVAGDVSSFARRRPGVFLLGAALAGFAAGRLLRGAAGSSNSGPSPNAPSQFRPQPVGAQIGNGGR